MDKFSDTFVKNRANKFSHTRNIMENSLG